jgi:hypothetical protein
MNLVERKKWLERELGREIPDVVWTELVNERYVKAGFMDPGDEELLVGHTQSYLRVLRGGTPDSDLEEEDWNSSRSFRIEHVLRREVFALCTAAMAAEHPEVRTFREEILGDAFPLTYGGALRFVDEDGHVLRDAPHARRLAGLVETLAATYLWRTYDASWFVLCSSYVPSLATFGVETKVVRHEHGPEIGTITLTVEPWVPESAVAQMYKAAQRQMLGKRPHAVGQKRLRLLAFAEKKGKSWRKRMDLWNESEASHKRKGYKDVRNFRKAYVQVRKVVLEPGYVTKARPNETRAREARRRRIVDALVRPEQQ